MMTKSASFAEARSQVRAALAAMGSSRPEAYIDCWAKSDDATLFGAWGPIEKGVPTSCRNIPLGRTSVHWRDVGPGGRRLF